MPRQPRNLPSNCTFHITVRCNNKEFNLAKRATRELLLEVIAKAKQKFEFKIYGLCIMRNHIHYLLAPLNPEELPKLMHWLNWYSAMVLNQLLHRTGHFWEQRYFSEAIPNSDSERILKTLRYIHANPKAAGLRLGFTYAFSNYGSYAQLTDDGLTEWHPAFLELGTTLEECARRYREFCKRYTPKKKKTTPRRHWGSCFLEQMTKATKPHFSKGVPGQLNLDLEGYQEACQVDPLGSWFGSKAAHQFITANGAAMMG
ncbi:MAG: transposase [Okeania sp. SIO2D1]|nr:transposase [Okeania sp. SIO2D1]